MFLQCRVQENFKLCQAFLKLINQRSPAVTAVYGFQVEQHSRLNTRYFMLHHFVPISFASIPLNFQQSGKEKGEKLAKIADCLLQVPFPHQKTLGSNFKIVTVLYRRCIPQQLLKTMLNWSPTIYLEEVLMHFCEVIHTSYNLK